MRSVEQKAAQAARHRERYAANPEKYNALNRAYYQANRERLIAKEKARYEANREAIRSRRKEHRTANLDAERAKDRARYRANPQPKLESVKRWRVTSDLRFREHGLTRQSYEAMYASQAGLCAICRGEFGRIPYIDHDHTTGVVRGLLCFHCNTALGHFRDSVENMRRAIRYVEVTL